MTLTYHVDLTTRKVYNKGTLHTVIHTGDWITDYVIACRGGEQVEITVDKVDRKLPQIWITLVETVNETPRLLQSHEYKPPTQTPPYTATITVPTQVDPHAQDLYINILAGNPETESYTGVKLHIVPVTTDKPLEIVNIETLTTRTLVMTKRNTPIRIGDTEITFTYSNKTVNIGYILDSKADAVELETDTPLTTPQRATAEIGKYSRPVGGENPLKYETPIT